LSALENACLPLLLVGKSGRQARQRARELLGIVGLGDRLDHQLAQLSGGEQQRVAIAMALANQPQLLLADEPTGEVDSASAKIIYDLFRSVCHEQGITTVIVSHDPGIARHVDRVAAVRDGKLASETVRTQGSSEHTQEMVVVDAAGRLQIPKDYLQRFDIQRRVLLEAQDEGILIRPAVHAGSEAGGSSPAQAGRFAEELPAEESFNAPLVLRQGAKLWRRLRQALDKRRRLQ
jgi:ABC-type methionine transport system ATPase subunit